MEIVNDGISYFPHITKFSDRWEGLLTEKAKESLFRQEFLKYKDAGGWPGYDENFWVARAKPEGLARGIVCYAMKENGMHQ